MLEGLAQPSPSAIQPCAKQFEQIVHPQYAWGLDAQRMPVPEAHITCPLLTWGLHAERSQSAWALHAKRWQSA